MNTIIDIGYEIAILFGANYFIYSTQSVAVSIVFAVDAVKVFDIHCCTSERTEAESSGEVLCCKDTMAVYR